MSFIVGASIRSRTDITPINAVHPAGVAVTYTHADGTVVAPSVALVGELVPGTWTYEAYFTPTKIGIWNRVWTSTDLDGVDVAQFKVYPA